MTSKAKAVPFFQLEPEGPRSRAVLKKKMTLNSLQAQRVMHRSFERVSRSLFCTDVILQIIAEPDEIAAVDEVINNHFEQLDKDLQEKVDQTKVLMEQNGIVGMIEYTNPHEYSIEITSPGINQFATLVQKLDNFIAMMDTLWLNQLIKNDQRSSLLFQWQQRLIRLASQIIKLENRTRIAARKKGKQAEVDQMAPEIQMDDDPELNGEIAEVDEKPKRGKRSRSANKEQELEAA
jgi:hypothetical protein